MRKIDFIYVLLGSIIGGVLGSYLAIPPDPWYATGGTGMGLGFLLTTLIRVATSD